MEFLKIEEEVGYNFVPKSEVKKRIKTRREWREFFAEQMLEYPPPGTLLTANWVREVTRGAKLQFLVNMNES